MNKLHLNVLYITVGCPTDPAWTQVSASTEQSIVLRADRFHQNPEAKEKRMGIKVNIWNKAKVRR